MTDWMLLTEQANGQRLGPDRKTPGTSVSPALADDASTSLLALPRSIKPSTATNAQSIHTTSRGNYRPLQSRNESSTPAPIPKKRKHSSKPTNPRPIRYFEGSSDEDEDSGHQSGDGSSSGDSVTSDGPMKVKRPRTSRVMTRSLTQTPVPNLTVETTTHAAQVASPSTDPATPAPLTGFVDTQTTSTPLDTTDNPPSPADTPGDSSHTETEVATTETTSTGPKFAVNGAEVAVTGTDAVTELRLTTDSLQVAVPTIPPSVTTIDKSKVPAFLLCHGKGARQVNIFAYLDKVQDPHFRQLLFYYIQFEANDKSGVGGALPTAKRPVEITQWTSRARPASLPNHTKERTFQMFVDSVFEWWGSIQPSWRIFERNRVSREVNGGWEALRSPRINGLLNVLILAYWWVQILDDLNLRVVCVEIMSFSLRM